tara:strand:+ start:13065 stop:13700 length:636 start_codon:yes stop_codon:yes gene_type:complete
MKSKSNINIFDCDGVILDSNDFKIDSLKKSFSFFNFSTEKVNQALKFFKLNFGLSRDKHFEMIGKILAEECNELKIAELRNLYDRFVSNDYKNCELIQSNVNFIKLISLKEKVFVVSASDQNELRSFLPKKIKIITEEKIFGGPRSKLNNILDIKKKFNNCNFIYYGDSINDAEASIKADINFIGLLKYSNSPDELQKFCTKKNLKTLQSL